MPVPMPKLSVVGDWPNSFKLQTDLDPLPDTQMAPGARSQRPSGQGSGVPQYQELHPLLQARRWKDATSA